MRKFLLSVVALLSCIGMANAQNALSVADITLPQNSDAALTVSFQLDAADTYTGYSFNLELPSELEFVMAEGTDVAYAKGACHDESHSVTANLSEGLVKVAGLSLSSKPLTGTSGTLLTFTIKPVGTLTVGQSYTCNIKDIIIVPVEGTKQNLAASSFTVTIGDPADLRTVLDETSTTAPEAASGVDVRVKRTINANTWSTICLPFAMTAAQMSAAFGDDVKLADFNGYDVEKAGENVTGISVKFNEATAIEANHPYIIKVSSAITEFTVDNVDVAPDEAEINLGSRRMPKSFIGNYVAGTKIENGGLFLNSGKFWYSVGTSKIKAFRAYFYFNDLLTDFEENYAEAPIMMVFDIQTNGIETIRATVADGHYYNLNGQRVENPGKGMYIFNNKKVVIK